MLERKVAWEYAQLVSDGKEEAKKNKRGGKVEKNEVCR